MTLYHDHRRFLAGLQPSKVAGAKAFARQAGSHAVLETRYLYDALECWWGALTGATALAHGLRGNSVLKQLQLTGNHVGDSGASALMASLVGLSKGFLVGLWLGRCGHSFVSFPMRAQGVHG